VEAEFEGEDGRIDAMLAWCREGPPAARVQAVEITELAPTGEQGFRVEG
jgi:acylphosphatase